MSSVKLSRKSIARLLCSSTLLLSGAPVWALSASHFAQTSKLASGKWAKIEVPESGVYELTEADLAKLGFNDPSKVKVFGRAGTMLPESLEATPFDDINQVPTIYTNGKVCFYGAGPSTRELFYSATEPNVRYTQNAYSRASYYFITDDDRFAVLAPEVQAQSDTATVALSTSFTTRHHERNLSSPSSSGKLIFGEDFSSDHTLSVDMTLPGYVPGTTMMFQCHAGAKVSEKTFMYGSVNGATMNFITNANRITGNTSEYVYYNVALGRGTVTPAEAAADDKYTIDLRMDPPGTITNAKLDFITFTYSQKNILAADSSQFDMMYVDYKPSKYFEVEGVDANTIVWNVSKDYMPTQYIPKIEGNKGVVAPDYATSAIYLVAFDPTRTLKKPASAKVIENQNIHGMEIPDMVIVSSKEFMEQANRIALMHEANDGMTVAVIDQEQIFNEFSTGVTDPMALRLLSKMLYARNSSKYKYLLLFGGGTFDNRHLIGNKSDNLIVTFQSTISNDEIKSYTCDNFFGMVRDNTGYAVASTPIDICVGRMPVKTLEEAENAVDKLLGYVNDTDFGDWRNNVLIMSDKGDNDIHIYQSEGIALDIMEKTSSRPVINRVYNEYYPLSNSLAIEARKKMLSELKRGQLIATYIGHGGPKNFTKLSEMWRVEDAKNETYEHLPFMTFASCDVARFDSDVRGIAEHMFHNPEGGIIAGVAASRAVYVSDNDALNSAIIETLLTGKPDGSQYSIGEAFVAGTKVFGTSANVNKLNFQLFGDPAMKLNYPHNQARITTVGGTDVTVADAKAYVNPMTSVKVVGEVVDAEGNIDTSFNGDVSLTLLDKQRVYKAVTTYKPERDIKYSREKLAIANGRAEAGKFEIELLVPKTCLAQGEAGAISVFAHRDDTRSFVNGMAENIIINPYDKSKAIVDTEAPVIEAMFLNEDSVATEDFVLPNPELHIAITDNMGICSQTLAVGNEMKLTLDGGSTSYIHAKNVARLSDSGKKAALDIILTDVANGKHTATFTVSDVAGNTTTKSIDFTVMPADIEATLEVDEEAVRTTATFTLTHQFADASQLQGTVQVIDAAGNTVWSTTTDAFPCEWNLTDKAGNRVAPGRYSYYATVTSGTQHAGTPMGTIVVLAPEK